MRASHAMSSLYRGADCFDGRHPAGEYSCRASALEGSQILFQPVTRGIRHSRVFVPFMFPQFLLDVRRCRIDRDRHGPGKWIGLLANVNGASGKAWQFILGHEFSAQKTVIETLLATSPKFSLSKSRPQKSSSTNTVPPCPNSL